MWEAHCAYCLMEDDVKTVIAVGEQKKRLTEPLCGLQRGSFYSMGNFVSIWQKTLRDRTAAERNLTAYAACARERRRRYLEQ